MATKKHYGIVERNDKENSSGKRNKYLLIGSFVLVALIVMWWGTQRVAFLYNFHPALGKPLFTAFDMHWYLPWKILKWGFLLKNPDISKIIEQCQLVFGLFLLLSILIYYTVTQKLKGNAQLHGSARWATAKQVKSMGYFDSGGVYVGGYYDEKKKKHLYLRHDGPEHILVFAPTRSGKGVGLILPTLLGWNHSSVVLDIKGENYALTSGYLKTKGHKVIKLDYSDFTGASAAHNVLQEVKLNGQKVIVDIQRIATMIMDPDGKGISDYWAMSGLNFIGGFMLHSMILIAKNEKRHATLTDISLLLDDPNREDGVLELFEVMKQTDHVALLKELFLEINDDLAKSAHSFIITAAQSMLSKSDKEVSGVVNTVTANFGLYRDPVLAQNIRRSDFEINDLMNFDVPVNLYLVVSPADLDRLRPLIRIFISQLLNRFTEKMEFADGGTKKSYEHRLLLLLDEFSSLGKVGPVERAISFQAGYGVKGYYIVQDLKQLKQAYGADNAIMSNCHIRIAYAPNDIETAEYLSKLTGTTTVVEKKRSRSSGKGGGSTTINIQETSRPLLTPDECTTLPGLQNEKGKITPGDMLIFTAGRQPIYGRQILYFKDPVFSKRAKMKPPGTSELFPGGISDSIYFEKEFDALRGLEKVDTPKTPDTIVEVDDYDTYFTA